MVGQVRLAPGWHQECDVLRPTTFGIGPYAPTAPVPIDIGGRTIGYLRRISRVQEQGGEMVALESAVEALNPVAQSDRASAF